MEAFLDEAVYRFRCNLLGLLGRREFASLYQVLESLFSLDLLFGTIMLQRVWENDLEHPSGTRENGSRRIHVISKPAKAENWL